MPRDKSRVESSLREKGFLQDDSHHHYYVYHTKEGKKTRAKTKTSHTKKPKDISDYLLNQMARQCFLSNTEFLELVDCPMDRDRYEKTLNEKELI